MHDEIHILLVEDNPGDVRLTVEALRGAKVANELHVVGDGEEAIEFLRQERRHVDAPRPDIVLLDLNLPRLDGHDVLADIKSDPDLAKIPIIVLTSSTAERDIEQAYELHAEGRPRLVAPPVCDQSDDLLHESAADGVGGPGAPSDGHDP